MTKAKILWMLVIDGQHYRCRETEFFPYHGSDTLIERRRSASNRTWEYVARVKYEHRFTATPFELLNSFVAHRLSGTTMAALDAAPVLS